MKTTLFNGTLSQLQYPPDARVLPPCAVCQDHSRAGYWLHPQRSWRLVGLCRKHDRIFRESGEYLRLRTHSSLSPISATAFADFVRRVQAEERHGQT